MSYSKPIAEIIQTRFSCRTYSRRPIAEDTRRRLAEIASASSLGPLGSRARIVLIAATAQDTEALRGLGTYGFIKDPTGFLAGAIRDEAKSLEDYGYLMEQVILCATDLDLGTCWLGGTFKQSRFAQKIQLRAGETMPAVVSVGYIAPSPRALDSVIRLGAGDRVRYPWSRLFFERELGVPLSREMAGAYTLPLDMVRLAPSASNKQPWRIIHDGEAWHFYLQRTRGYRERNRLSPVPIADLQRVDMGIAMCHFALTAREMGLEGQWVISEPAVARADGRTEYTVSWIGDVR